MSRIPNHPLFPATDRVQAALRLLLYTQGSEFCALWAKDTYEPLADFFGLDQTTRSISRAEYLDDERNEPYWHTWVQWAKDKLLDAGELTCPRRGLWKLTELGVTRTRVLFSNANSEALKSYFGHQYEKVMASQLKPIEELTLEDLGL